MCISKSQINQYPKDVCHDSYEADSTDNSLDNYLGSLMGLAVADAALCEEIANIAAGSFKYKSPPKIVGSSYVVKSLEEYSSCRANSYFCQRSLSL